MAPLRPASIRHAEHIRDDPSMATDVMESADYLRVELHNAADHEMIA